MSYQVLKTRSTLWGAEPGPAILVAPNGQRYTFEAGYGDRGRYLTQQGCELIERYLVATGLLATPLTLTAALDTAKAWRGEKDA